MVLTGRGSFSDPAPPASDGQLSSPSAKSPWQEAPWSANSSSPVSPSPAPSRRPWPSGNTATSQAAISSGRASRPMPSGSASAGPATSPATSRAANAGLRDFDIFHLAVLFDPPGLDAVVVIDVVQ